LVVGVPDDDLGQVPHAIVQADGLDEAAVKAFLAEHISSYKVPHTVEFSDTPLRDDAGKARRSAVRNEVIARRQAQARQ
jgi:bile acid-coenzyme A ligase